MKTKNLLSILSLAIASLISSCKTTVKEELIVIPITSMCVTNCTADSVQAYLTLGSIGDTNYVQNTSGIFGISDSGTQNSFWIAPNDTLCYTSPLGKGFNGNITFGTPPVNCPDTTQFPNGINLLEFALNNNFAVNSQETVDISCVAGVNCIINTTFTGGGAWNNGTDSISVIENGKLYSNTGLSGVYPYMCDSCIGTTSKVPYCAGRKPKAKPQATKICNIQRNSTSNGGVIVVGYKGVAN